MTLPLVPGRQDVSLAWRQNDGMRLLFRTPEVNVGAASVNARASIAMPADRWTLWLRGPRLGPAVLFWSLLTVSLLVSIALGRAFNLLLVLAAATLAALAGLFWSITNGLLGLPEMQISGNDSSGSDLRWYLDRSGDVLRRPWVFSVPLFLYRLAMLAWALWLAQALLRWLKWAHRP